MRYLVICLILSTQLLTACSSGGDEKRQAYLDADYYSRLEFPPDLTRPDDSRQMKIPAPTEKAAQHFQRETAHLGQARTSDTGATAAKAGQAGDSETVVMPAISSARLQSQEGIFWLEVDENAEQLWSQISAFWGNEGIKVVRNEPVLGVVETDWVSKLQQDPDAGLFSRMFQSGEPDKLDKFTMRIEPQADKARIYVSHSGLEMSVEGDDINWRSRCSEEELEREMLQRFALYFGLDRQQAEQVFEDYRPYASRVKLPEDEVHVLYVTGSLNFVWKRTLRALDRLGMDIREMDAVNSRILIGLSKLDISSDGERDEIAESSWLMQWFTGTEEEAVADPDRRFNLKLAQQNGVVKLAILDATDQVSESVLTEQFRNSLAIELQ